MPRSELEKLGNLYSATGHDWVLEVSHILTEPTCPTVVIVPEGSNMVRYRVDADTIEEGIRRAVAMVYEEIIQRKRRLSECPFTNPDDKHFDVWLERRLGGSDEELPGFPSDALPAGDGWPDVWSRRVGAGRTSHYGVTVRFLDEADQEAFWEIAIPSP